MMMMMMMMLTKVVLPSLRCSLRALVSKVALFNVNGHDSPKLTDNDNDNDDDDDDDDNDGEDDDDDDVTDTTDIWKCLLDNNTCA